MIQLARGRNGTGSGKNSIPNQRENLGLLNKGGSMPKYICTECKAELHGWSLKEMGTVCPMCEEPVKEQEVEA